MLLDEMDKWLNKAELQDLHRDVFGNKGGDKDKNALIEAVTNAAPRKALQKVKVTELRDFYRDELKRDVLPKDEMVDELTAVLDKVQLQTPPRRPPKLGDRIDDFFDNIESADAASLPPVVKEAMDSFKQQGRELIYVKPVYLGDVPAYKNYPSEIKSGAMSKKIEDDFSDMTDKDYKFHPLKDFFEKEIADARDSDLM